MRFLTGLLSLVAFVTAGSVQDRGIDQAALAIEGEVDVLFDNFKTDYGRVYESREEEELRRDIFEENVNFIRAHNEKYLAEDTTYFMGINQFADMTYEEMRDKVLGFRMDKMVSNMTIKYKTLTKKTMDAEVDWRDKGAVTEVLDQGECGSCWAFSTTGVIEGQHFLVKGELVSISEQQLCDCSWDYGNEGCVGGLPWLAYEYLIDNEGDEGEADYPYTAKDSHECKFDKSLVKATISNWYGLKQGDEENLALAVAQIGPISCGMDAEKSFMLYAGGIYSDSLCSNEPSELNHAVLAVGFGTENGQDYWIIKNSYGKEWGEQGYIRMSRNNGNTCGIATAATFPEI